MSDYQQALIVNGMPPEQAACEAQLNEWLRIQNREHPAYGNYDPAPPRAEDVRQAYRFKYFED